MNKTDYVVAAGFIQWEPEIREVNGQTVRDVKVHAIGSQKPFRITLWPEYAGIALQRGDFIVAEGRLRTSVANGADGTVREYNDIDAARVVRLEPAPKQERAPQQASSKVGMKEFLLF
jgi:hypothetical protein